MGFCSVVENRLCVGKVMQGRMRDGLCLPQERRIVSQFGEVDQAAQHDTLVVGPCGPVIVVAGRREAIVDEAVLADHSGLAKPVPLSNCPALINTTVCATGSEGELGCDGE